MTTIPIEIDARTVEAIDELSGRLGRPREIIVHEAIAAYIAEAESVLAFVQEGLNDLDHGRVVSHEDVMRQFRDRFCARPDAAVAAE